MSNYNYKSDKKLCEDLRNEKVLFVLENIDYLIENYSTELQKKLLYILK